ncbi:hypothetical protein RND81_05G113300 [Saponaria officinalis]|uniref:Flowering time control protein FCA n=1 Tax=Saponaria officinalis TaxID=3572 RepID=A0AAW1KRZ9_SAPOF
MDRPYRHERDRNDRDHYRDRDIHRDRDRDRDFHRQPRRPSGFSDGPPHLPPPENHRGSFSYGGPLYPPQPDLRRSPPPFDHRRGPYPLPPDHHRGGLPPGGRNFDSSPRQPPPAPDEFRPTRGGVGGPLGGVGGGFGSDFPPQRPPLHHSVINHHHPSPPQLSGQKRGFSFPDRGGGSPEHYEGKNFVKLFVGSVPSTATEEEIRSMFEKQGNVLEVALIKDKRTGQQQGCCFIKYASSEEADRAIRALHNQYTLPGGVGPVQVRYADGERERLGNVSVEYKLFVSALNKYATEKEVEEIFAPYGPIDDVYLMRDERRQSRGCGFVKFSNKDSAMAAVNALNGIYTMRGCDQPLIVRFAIPKRPRAGEQRAGPALGGPGSGPSPSPGFRPAPGSNFLDTKGGQDPPNAGQSLGPRNMGLSPSAGIYAYGNQLPPRSGEAPISSIPGGYTGAQGDNREGSFTGSASATCASAQDFNHSYPQVPLTGQQQSPLPNRFPPQHFSPALQQNQVPGSFFQAPTSQPSVRPPSQQQSNTPAPQSFQLQQLQSLPGQMRPAQYQVQQSATSGTAQPRPNTPSSQPNSQPATSAPQQPLYQQSPSQLAQMLSQQTQTLQASFQSSQQTFSHLQQQFQMMQPLPHNQPLQQSFQASKQSQWAGAVPATAANAPNGGPTRDAPPPTSLAPSVAVAATKAASAKCDWTEHTSPGGYKYYYNSATGESTWEKPEELSLYEQLQQKSAVTQPQPLAQQNVQATPTQQVSQSQPSQLQTQYRNADHLNHHPTYSIYPAPGCLGNQTAQEKTYSQSLPPANSVPNPSTFQQGFPADQDWAWNNSRGN